MKHITNRENIEGYLYQVNIEKKESGPNSKHPGTIYIAGDIEVATDEEGFNIIPIHFTYTTATTSTGKKNNTFDVLSKIIDEKRSWLDVGKENATKVRVDTAFGLNDFYNNDDELVSAKRNEGGFVSIINKFKHDEDEIDDRSSFETDMVITSIKTVEANEERQTDEYVAVRGCVFNFRGELLPTEFVVKSQAGMKYFNSIAEDISPNKPFYTKVFGTIKNATIKTEKVQESAFGEAKVIKTERNIREWVITGASPEPYDFEESDANDLRKAQQDREVQLAEKKKRNEEYKASKNSGTIATSTPVKQGGFNF
jgi:hypothetical protein